MFGKDDFPIRWVGELLVSLKKQMFLSCLPAVSCKNCHAHRLTVFFQSCCSVFLWHEKPGLLKKQLRVEFRSLGFLAEAQYQLSNII